MREIGLVTGLSSQEKDQKIQKHIFLSIYPGVKSQFLITKKVKKKTT
jgi:hypothetical protein